MKLKFNEIVKSEIQPFTGYTYDLEVKEDHSYNIEGTIVHNSACLTAPNTGFGTMNWQLSAVSMIAEAFKNSPIQIIADGGIRKYGDFAKSIAFGADMIMVGGLLSGFDENPGEILEVDGEYKKAFFGSASEHQKGEQKHVEGKKMLVPYRGSMETELQIIKENLQSSVSYCGGKKLSDLTNAQYVLLRK